MEVSSLKERLKEIFLHFFRADALHTVDVLEGGSVLIGKIDCDYHNYQAEREQGEGKWYHVHISQ